MSVHARRRLGLLLVVVALGAGIVAAVASSGGASGSGAAPAYDPGGPAVASPAGPSAALESAPRPHRPFVPSPAATRLAATLTLPQQVAQLFLVSVDGSGAPAAGALTPADAGGVVLTRVNFVTDGQVQALAADVASTATAAGAPPPLIAATQEGGPQTAFPDLPPEGEAQIGAGPSVAADAQTARAQALLAAEKLKDLGVDMTIAPLADVDTPDGALSGRLFSTDPTTVARLSLAAVLGYGAGGVISAVGHFPGSGAASADPDVMTATVGGTLAALRQRDLIPFAALVRRAPVIEMSNASYVAFDGVTPAGLLPAAVSLLRDGFGFTRVVMSDDLDATLNATGETPGQVAVQALEAGDDLLYITGPAGEHEAAYDAVLKAAEASAAVRARVHLALLHDLTLKSDYGVL